jgi:hypothetical protein
MMKTFTFELLQSIEQSIMRKTKQLVKVHTKLLTLLLLLLTVGVGNVWGQETVTLNPSASGPFAIDSEHNVAGYFGSTSTGTLTAADDGFTATKGGKMDKTSNKGSALASKSHVRFDVKKGETV